ncbi:Glycosyl transferase WcbB [Cupriavidus necator]|uniref:glycosyltransferase family 4 protein n=1 Tax=Cupriavidus necator TaxID=106590 RepID=UPI003F73672B
MIPIFLDVTRLLDRLGKQILPTGVDRVGLLYIKHYAHRARAVLSIRGFNVVLSAEHSAEAFDLLLKQHSCPPTGVKSLFVRAICSALRHEVFDGGVLLHTSHSGLEYGHYFKSLKRRNIHTVFMLHDLIPVTHAEYCRPGVREIHLERMRVALGHAKGIVANSQATLDSLVQQARHNGWSVPGVVVARLASGVSGVAGECPLVQPYFVMLGTIEPRKNHWLLLHVWRRLVEVMGQRAPVLVVIGRRGWECENVIDMLERCAPLRGKVIEEANCSDERLCTYLHHARALLFPSFVEGYGMPLAEALAMRVPVIASDLAAFREIAGEIPEYLDPLDGLGWMTRVMEYASEESPQRAAQIERIEGFREPTWEQHFSAVDRFIEELM